MQFSVDIERLTAELDSLATFSDDAAPAVSRVVFSENDRRAREYVKALTVDAGLEVRVDAVGNTFARWTGSNPNLPAVATGSHIDAIPHSGKYDGTVGVLGGLEAIRALKGSGYMPKRSIEVIIFTAEEPTRFGIGCLGSRMLSGTLSVESAFCLRDHGGSNLNQLRERIGIDGNLHEVQLPLGFYSSFVELHIEQGPLLERESIPVGIVESIAAPAAMRMTFSGRGGHAGAVLMPERNDAFLAAAEAALLIESLAKSTNSVDSVATVGVCNVFPGAVNSIPSRVQIEIDIRDTDGNRRDQLLDAIKTGSERIAAARKVRLESELVNADLPAHCDAMVTSAVREGCRASNVEFKSMISHAYHDSLFMSRIAPVGMILIPCREGISHKPEEYSSPESIKIGVEVLTHTLAQLSS